MNNKIRIISHRGNQTGPNPEQENHPPYIQAALFAGFDVEIDVWFENEHLVLGHDKPQFPISKEFFYNDRLWVHCKNIEALFALRHNPVINRFYHNTDACTSTSQNLIWTYPDASHPLFETSIAVLPERVPEWDLFKAYGICTDYPIEYKKDLNFKLLNP